MEKKEGSILFWTYIVTFLCCGIMLLYELAYILKDISILRTYEGMKDFITNFINVIADFGFPLIDFVLGITFIYLFYSQNMKQRDLNKTMSMPAGGFSS